MNRKNATRKALLLSVISLLLCCTMLVGTTFAWFTDSVTSGLNSIVAGNLDIELEYSKDATSWASVSGKTDLFSGALWEPGHTEVVYLKLTNKGTLALNYQLGINVKSETPAKNVEDKEFKLSDHIQFGIVEDQATAFASRAAAVAAVTNGKPLNAGYTKANSMTAQNETTYLALVVYMPESVGNEANYRGTAPQIELGINVVASQKTAESDSFGNDYDVLAQGGYAQTDAPTTGTKEITVYTPADAGQTPVEAATVTVPAEAVADNTKPIEVSIVPTAKDASVTVTAEQSARTYDITVSNIKEGNTQAITVELNVGKGLTGVSLYHKDQLVPGASYDKTTGYVTFTTTSFSPYTVVHDAVADNKIYNAEDLIAAMTAGGQVVLGANIAVDDTTIVVGKGVTTVLDLNGFTLSANNTRTATHNLLIDVKGGTLTIKNGTVEMTHTGTNMNWNGAATIIDVTAGGVLNLRDATLENKGGTDMNFVVHLNNWGEATLNVDNSVLKATYMAVRVFNSGPDKNYVTINNTTLSGKYSFWVHNYVSSDFGGKLYSAAKEAYDVEGVNARLVFDIYGNGNTFEYTNDYAPVRYGFNESVFYDANGNLVE